MRGLDRGETFIVTRRGVPVGELIPIRRHRFASRLTPPGCSRRPPRSTARASSASGPARQPGRRTTWLTRSREGLVDTSVVIDLERLDAPFAGGAGGLGADDGRAGRRAARRRRSGRASPTSGPAAALAGPGRSIAVRRRGGSCLWTRRRRRGVSRTQGPGLRAVDLLIAATALAHRLPLYTRNGDDFRFLGGLVEVIKSDVRSANTSGGRSVGLGRRVPSKPLPTPPVRHPGV